MALVADGPGPSAEEVLFVAEADLAKAAGLQTLERRYTDRRRWATTASSPSAGATLRSTGPLTRPSHGWRRPRQPLNPNFGEIAPLAANPPRYSGRVEVEKGTEGTMLGVDGRFLIAGSGEVLAPGDGKPLGRLADEQGNPTKASNNMMSLEVDAATDRILRTNQQCAPAWPGPGAVQ